MKLSRVSYALKQGGELFEVRGVLQTQERHRLAKAAAHFQDTPHLVEFDISRISKQAVAARESPRQSGFRNALPALAKA